jgi:hypothetical protein
LSSTSAKPWKKVSLRDIFVAEEFAVLELETVTLELLPSKEATYWDAMRIFD